MRGVIYEIGGVKAAGMGVDGRVSSGGGGIMVCWMGVRGWGVGRGGWMACTS